MGVTAEARCLQSKFSEETMLAKGTRDGRRFEVQEQKPKVIGISQEGLG